MKRIIASVLACLLVVAACAQTGSKHLTFKGEPIDGDIQSFVQKMQAKGFSLPDYTLAKAFVSELKDIGLDFTSTVTDLESYADGTASLYGDFAGYTNCHVTIVAAPSTRTVYTVAVTLYSDASLSNVLCEYNNTKSMLVTKYGEPTDDYSSQKSVFETSAGTITLAIENDDLTITYVDRQNSQAAYAKALEDL